MNPTRRQLLGSALASSAIGLAGGARADTWPSRPIRLIVGFPPGGGTDIVARALAPRMSEVLGQQVVIENKSGASGTIGADFVAKSPSDGYTLVMGHAIPNAIAPNVLSKVGYDPDADFTAITYIGFVPNVLVLYPGIPVRTVPELIALAKREPGKLTYASSGIGSTQHLAGALFNKLTHVEMTHIPYKGSGQAVTDLLGGQVSMNFDTMPTIVDHAKGGRLRAIAISTPQRHPSLPDVPTFNEQGITGFDVTNWYAVMGPRAMPRAIVDRINEAVKTAMADPAIGPRLEQQGVIFGGPATPDEFTRFIRGELVKYAKMTKELGVKSE